jgi:probable rRNA maturation factor
LEYTKKELNTQKKQQKSTHKKSNLIEILKTVLAKMEENEPDLRSKTIEVCLVDSEIIKDLNRRYFGRNIATDILSFPNEFEESNSLGELVLNKEYVPKDLINIENDAFEVAIEKESTISSDKVSFNHPSIQHLVRLFIHGTLHLIGYNHIGFNEKIIMEQKEATYLKLWDKEELQ